MRVVLCTICVLSAVEGDDLVTEDIVSSNDIGRDGASGGVVVGDQSIRGPRAGAHGPADQTGGADTEEVERGLVGIGAVTGAQCQIAQNGTLVGLWPCSPLNGDV